MKDSDGLSLPLLSSEWVGWPNIRLEHHVQAAHKTPELTFPQHVIEVGLRYDATELKVNGLTYRHFLPGNIAIHPANTPICIESYGEAEFIAIALPPSQFQDSELVPQLFGQDPLILQMAIALKQSLASGTDSPLYAESMATALSAHLTHRYSTRRGKMRCLGGLSQRQLNPVIDYVDAHLGETIRLCDLAAIAHLSTHHFATLFKQATGTSPYQYIISRRVERAKQLLANPTLSIVEIGHQVGFRSQSHFTQMFRRCTHVTPKVYRQSL